MMEEGRAAALLCATGSKVGLKRGSWTAEEDMRLIAYINKYGYPNWRALPEQAGLLRCGKSCQLRWINYLRPGLKRGNFTAEENETIIKLHAALGNKWSRIAAFLPGRTDNEIKNVWNAHLKKRVAHTATTASAGEHKNGGTKSSKKKRLACVNAVPLPSAASTTTATTNAADDQSNTNKEEEPAELHKFEIPLLDLGYDLDMILDAIPDTRYAPTTSPCSSAYRPGVGHHQLLDVPEILPDLCGIMDGEGGAGAGAWNNAAPCHSNGTDASAGTANNEKEWWWLEDLDQELGL